MMKIMGPKLHLSIWDLNIDVEDNININRIIIIGNKILFKIFKVNKNQTLFKKNKL